MGLRIFYPLRRNHSFGVCTLACLGTTIRSSLGRAPSEIPLPRARTGFSLACCGILGRLGRGCRFSAPTSQNLPSETFRKGSEEPAV